MSPLPDGFENRSQGLALVGETIAHRRGATVSHLAAEDSLLFELPEPLGQEAIADAGDSFPNPAKSDRPLFHGCDDSPRPTLADELDRAMKNRANLGNCLF